MNTDVKFSSISNFSTKMTSTSGQQIEVKANKNYENIQVQTNSDPLIIPIKTSKDSTMTVDTSGAGYIRYIIDNETGSYLVLENRLLQLFSKSGNLLSAVNIPKELPEYSLLRNKFLYVDESGNLAWVTGGGSGTEYYSGAAISISEDRKINLVYDTNVLYVKDDGALTINTDTIQEKLQAGDNISIEGTRISATDTKYTAGTGIKIDEQDNKISLDADVYNYNQLDNKPSINGITLIGALLGKDLGLDRVEYITYKQYRNIEVKEPKVYFVCKNTKDLEAEDCWRIYLQNKLIGEWDVQSGMVTLPVFPMRFPFRFA